MRTLACLSVFTVAGCTLVFSSEAADTLFMPETIAVPSDGRTMVSQNTLAEGVTFRITASGTYQTSGSSLGDAEYYSIQAQPRDLDDPPSLIDVGIAIDDDVVDMIRTPRWGSYRDDHVYTIMFQGTGAPISVQLHDGTYANNAGEMSLLIESIEPVE